MVHLREGQKASQQGQEVCRRGTREDRGGSKKVVEGITGGKSKKKKKKNFGFVS